jgi:antitoxin HicB
MRKGKQATQHKHYPVEVHWSEEDQAFLAEVYDLPGCIADGPTEAEAIAAAHEAAELWLEVAQKEGRPVPAPSTEEPASGKFVLRLPTSLHRELRERARREKVPLNALVVTLLAQREAETRS